MIVHDCVVMLAICQIVDENTKCARPGVLYAY